MGDCGPIKHKARDCGRARMVPVDCIACAHFCACTAGEADKLSMSKQAAVVRPIATNTQEILCPTWLSCETHNFHTFLWEALSVLAKESHGACSSLCYVVWALPAGSSWWHRSCHPACPSAVETTSSCLQQRAPFPASSPAALHGLFCLPLAIQPSPSMLPRLLTHPSTFASLSLSRGGETWVYLSFLETSTCRAVRWAGAPPALPW